MRPPRPGVAVSLGVDFGSTGLRAAFALPDGPVRQLEIGPGGPWLLCETLPAGPVPVGFPSLKSVLGSDRRLSADGVPATPEEVIAGRLGRLREQVASAAAAPVGQTVVCVPAGYGSAQRSALLDAARSAGLGRVRLINDASAAVIGHTDGQGSSTFLVYGMGYGGYELGLVRAARGNYRVLGYETADSPGGREFDAAVLAAWLQAQGSGAAVPDDEAGWRRLRTRAQELRERLASGADDERAVLAPKVEFHRSGATGLDAFLDRHVARTLRHADTLLEQARMTTADVDTLLLVGGCTRMRRVRDGLRQWFGREGVATAPGLLALGALQYAVRLGVSGAADQEDIAPALDDPAHETLGDAPRLTATLLSGDGPPTGTALARSLLAQGRTEEARDLLHRIVREAQDLLGELPAAPATAEAATFRPAAVTAAPPSGTRPEDADHPTVLLSLLGEARRLLKRGRYEQAVRASHAAWEGAGTRPEGVNLLDGMIEVHCTAAMADTAVEHFADADRWLRCAYGHDPTNTRVRRLLGERTYRHAVELDRRGLRDDAVQALETCLTWDPDHDAATALLRRLTRPRRPPQRTRESPGRTGP